ncbi:MAG: hypothetical protein ACOYKC_01595 [Anaerolineaceae bacterium]|jgi:hypothetical protein
MKKNVLRAVYLLMVFVLIASLGTNQVKAGEVSQNGGDDAYFLTSKPFDEEVILDSDANSETSFGFGDMPQLAAGAYRLNFSGDEFTPWNYLYASDQVRVLEGCVGIKLNSASSSFYGATLPLSIPAGSTIHSIVFTGVDNFNLPDRHLEYHLRRYKWNGTTDELIKKLQTTDAFASPNPFWMNAVNINHVVSPDYTYYLYIRMFPVWDSWDDLKKLKICQLGVEYYPPSAFMVAIPTVRK